jgi:hypothetical protein
MTKLIVGDVENVRKTVFDPIRFSFKIFKIVNESDAEVSRGYLGVDLCRTLSMLSSLRQSDEMRQ